LLFCIQYSKKGIKKMNQPNTILTLDAGGTNFVFSAIRDAKAASDDFSLPAKSDSLDELLLKIISGFKEVEKQSGNKAAAISFSFPGPADYEKGIIGKLENLPLFRGGVALKQMLENEFQIPVFINNDGNLFTLGEAMHGLLPDTNKKLREAGIDKQYKNLLGVTLGTGFGGGIVLNGQLLSGDNSATGEINRMSNLLNRNSSVEEALSIRGVKRLFSEEAHCGFENTPEPYDIFRIGLGEKRGDKAAAVAAWEKFAIVLADAIGNAVSLVDGLVVIGGGLAGAHPLFLQKVLTELNGHFNKSGGGKVSRLEVAAFNLETADGLSSFLEQKEKQIKVPFSDEVISWFPDKKTGVGISHLGTSQAVAMGAYAFALGTLKNQ
jgi:glucokinase